MDPKLLVSRYKIAKQKVVNLALNSSVWNCGPKTHIETVTKKMTLAFWAVEHFLVIFHQICIKYTKSIWFSALKWGTVHFCTYLEIKDTGKNVKKCFFQFHHFCKKKFVKIMHHTLHHFCMNFLAKACLFLQKFKTYLKVTFQGLLRRYTTLF